MPIAEKMLANLQCFMFFQPSIFLFHVDLSSAELLPAFSILSVTPARSLLPLFSFLLLLLSPPPPPPTPSTSPPLSLEDTRSVARVSIWGSISPFVGGFQLRISPFVGGFQLRISPFLGGFLHLGFEPTISAWVSQEDYGYVGSENYIEEPTTHTKFPNSIDVPGCSSSLFAVGTGYREKVFAIIGVKVYAAALYVNPCWC
ncbi:hypothetical protein Droror1_Dr00026503 [Drosera rotundifolia]